MRTFGIELEIKGISVEDIMAAVRTAGAQVTDCRHSYGQQRHVPAGHWQVTYDGSVTNGYELVSPVGGMPASEEMFALCNRITRELAARGARADKECGYHVHVGAANLSGLSLLSLYVYFLRYEKLLDKLLTLPRRGNRNRYAKSNRVTLGGGRQTAIASLLHHVGQNPGALDNVERVLGNLRSLADRYHKFNMQSMREHGTVEFRAHQGTVTPQAVEVWARTCVALVDKAAKQTKLPALGSRGMLVDLLRKLPASLRGPLVARMETMRRITSPRSTRAIYTGGLVQPPVVEAAGTVSATCNGVHTTLTEQYVPAAVEAASNESR